MQIQILSVTPKQLPAKTPGKTYSALEVAFKNLTFQGKVEGKNLVAFGSGKAAYDTLLNSSPGEVYEVSIVKENGYNQWTTATKSDGAAPNVGTISPGYSPKPVNGTNIPSTAAPRSNYETPEERAKKQIYIVRQSSISNAVDLLSVGQKSPPDVKAVLEAAKQFEAFVFGEGSAAGDAGDSFFDTKVKPDFTDTGDDIPF